MKALLENWSDNVQGVEATVALLVLLIGCVAGFFAWVGRKRPRSRLRSFYKRAEDWWKEFYLHVANREEDRRIGQMERSVAVFLKDSGLGGHVIKMTPRLRAALLGAFGIKPEFASKPEMFSRWTKLPFDGITIEDFWLLLTTAAYRFRSAWPDCTPENASQNIENPLKWLRVYCGYREE